MPAKGANMDHWFDRVAKGLALDRVSRRDALKLSFGAGLAGAWGGLLKPIDALAQNAAPSSGAPPSRVRVENRGPCTVIRNAEQTTVHYSVQSKFNGESLTFDGTQIYFHPTRTRLPIVPHPGGGGRPEEVVQPSGSTRPEFNALSSAHLPFGSGGQRSVNLPAGPSMAGSETLKLGSDVVLHIDRASRQGSVQIKVTYGAVFHGVKQTSFSSNGKVIEGDVDGRRVVPLPVGTNVNKLKFADGRPGPGVVIDAALRDAIRTLRTESPSIGRSCFQGGSQPSAGAQELSVGGAKCENCLDSCNSALLWCEGIAAGACLFALWFDGACEVAAMAGCGSAFVVCSNNCDNPGGDCCPVACPNGSCCDDGETCIADGSCCPRLQIVCSGACCSPGISQCNQGICCPANQVVCNSVCCPQGQVCSTEGTCCPPLQPGVTPVSCHGVCCPQGQVCHPEGVCCPPKQPVCNSQFGPVCCQGGGCDTSGQCCPPPMKFCGKSKSCCPPFNVCCGDTCCGLNEVCLTEGRTGQPLGCCPASQTCGVGGENPVCCPNGQICVDTQNSTCGPCPAGQVACRSVGNGAIVCCAQGVNCCNGTCCKPQEICCTNIFGSPQVFGCHLESLCIN
jgi:hypothetical protein